MSTVVKDLTLTTEHLKRILEFANIKAYLREYEKLGSENTGDGNWTRYVSFRGGLAQLGEIMSHLDQKETEQEEPVPDSNDYLAEPQDYKAVKVAAEHLPDTQQEKLASFEEEGMPKVSLDNLYSSLGSAISKVEDQILRLTNLEEELGQDFLKTAKQAVMQEYSLGDIRKVASAQPEVRLDRALNTLAYGMKSVFWSDDDILQSFEKVSQKAPVPDHPIAVKYAAWKEAANQLKTASRTREILQRKQAKVLNVVKEMRNVR